ncbi:MAG TPA: phosphate ABC transporter permease subunit PstC [Spirochaetales bacterium]|nr:phosphate ABC transporter permease subunit PstC [Spirochaetales bacterium]
MNDKRYFRIISGAAMALLLAFAAVLLTLAVDSVPTLQVLGLGFLTGKQWNPVTKQYGALPFLSGTLLTSFVALLVSLPLSLSVGIVMGEYLRNSFLSKAMSIFINLLASIPSVVYGLWGMTTIVPLVQKLEGAAGVAPYGVGILSASLVLAVMILPYMASLTAEVMQRVPNSMREAALALGTTRQEMILGVSIPYIRSGIAAGILLALGRALGETMAVTMLIGNATRMPNSVFALGNTLASVIASQFNEAESDLHRSAMMALALVLFILSFLTNLLGRRIIGKTENGNV